VVRDVDAAEATYQRLLGRRCSWRGAHPGMGTANALFRLEDCYLELLAPAAEGALASDLRGGLERDGEGLRGLAFGTPDAARCAAFLRERGLPAGEPREGEGRLLQGPAVRRWRNVLLPASATRGVLLFAIEHLTDPDLLPPAEPLAEPGEGVDGLDHVVVASADLEASRALYGDGLGLRLALDRSFEQRGMRLLFFRVGGITVEIAGQLDGAAGAAGDPAGEADAGASGRDRLFGLAYRVGHVERARKRVAAAGFDVSETRAGRKPGTRVCSVRSGTHGVATLLIGPDRA
jgi:catechol 2,3-dioxygenase-like lactoylglutathione lyase family enzyme